MLLYGLKIALTRYRDDPAKVDVLDYHHRLHNRSTLHMQKEAGQQAR
jgi:hypothetical protein